MSEQAVYFRTRVLQEDSLIRPTLFTKPSERFYTLLEIKCSGSNIWIITNLRSLVFMVITLSISVIACCYNKPKLTQLNK